MSNFAYGQFLSSRQKGKKNVFRLTINKDPCWSHDSPNTLRRQGPSSCFCKLQYKTLIKWLIKSEWQGVLLRSQIYKPHDPRVATLLALLKLQLYRSIKKNRPNYFMRMLWTNIWQFGVDQWVYKRCQKAILNGLQILITLASKIFCFTWIPGRQFFSLHTYELWSALDVLFEREYLEFLKDYRK